MWWIIGIIIFLITYFVHRHTIDCFTKERVSSPLWAVILIFIISMIPIVNIIAFIGGIIVYISYGDDGMIYFSWKNKPKFIEKIIEIFEKNV